MSHAEEAKKACAIKAVDTHVKSGQVVSLGTGSTAKYVILEIADRVKKGTLENLTLLATSLQSEQLATENGLAIVTLDDLIKAGKEPVADVAIDGCDEVDPEFNLVKGRGGALLREKLLETGARKFIVTADESKVVKCLGTGATPVEIVQFCPETTIRRMYQLPSLKGKIARHEFRTVSKESQDRLVTDNGNFIVDLYFKDSHIDNAPLVSHELAALVGVVDTGFFIGMKPEVIIGKHDGTVITL
eukprot:Blabericola_migrator_1__15@NODE_1005_length_5722_cov_152_220336_g691_i0_p4_GENE_NODE_1005_length_5722_cov_152_220336_g691_i0NODE_1005_length_5722_cov_152_220336_g691_i0_p4_ORF_typecomplete_len252_score60_02Rib_5P_isom_A/PF06026_14/5_5e48DeoRC/PF00455_22/0_0011DeoRC/PF00455_22/7_7e03Sugarbind/PF04198_13/0_14_NODE_1005_length_5722_cov_152_220336_g691_i049675701